SVRADARRSLSVIRRKFPQARILVHGEDAYPSDITQLLAQGADGYFSLALGEQNLVKAIRVLERGLVWLPEKAVSSVVKQLRAPQPGSAPELTMREYELLRMLHEGLSNKEMAARSG